MTAFNYDSAGGGSYATLATALAAIAATDDVIYALSTSNEMLGASTNFAASATFSLPGKSQKLYSVDSFSVPAVTAGAKLTINGSFTLTFEGSWDISGIETYYSGSNNTVQVRLGGNAQSAEIRCDNVSFNIRSNSANSIPLSLGTNTGATTADSYRNWLTNCSVYFGSASQAIGVFYGEHFIDNLSLIAGSSAPTRLIKSGPGIGVSKVELSNSDLSGTAIGALMGATAASQLKMFCRNLKLHATTNFMDGACTVHNELLAVNCSSGDAHIQSAYYGYAGSVISDSTVYIAGAMQDGGTDMSRKMTPASAGRSMPLQTELLIPVSDNATVQPWVEISSNVALTDIDAFIDVEIITTDTTTLGTKYTTHPGLLASGSSLTASAETWVNGGMYNYKIQLASAVVARQDHLVRIVVNVTNPSAVVYVGKYGA